MQLSEYCFSVCKVLKTVVQGRDADSLNESVGVALEDLERCVAQFWLSLLPCQATPGSYRKSNGLSGGG